MATPVLRQPREQLGGCCWLPRFRDKARAAASGSLPLIYRVLLGNAGGIDGHFLSHFQLRASEALAAVRQAPDDAATLAWFRSQPGVSDERIAAWNQLGPTLGGPGGPMRWSFPVVRALLYPGVPRTAANSFFELIEADEKKAG